MKSKNILLNFHDFKQKEIDSFDKAYIYFMCQNQNGYYNKRKISFLDLENYAINQKSSF